MIAKVLMPKVFRIGGGALAELPVVLRELGLSRPMVVTDGFLSGSPMMAALRDVLPDQTTPVFDGTTPDPTDLVVEAGLAALRSNPGIDCLVAFGGGSPIDTAKAIALMAGAGGRIRDHKVPNVVERTGLPVIAIPTTAGTGSEATRFTIVTDTTSAPGQAEKMLIAGPGLMPLAAIVDYRLTMSVPPRTTADTGVDSLTHALEAYVSKLATPWSDTFATAAMPLIFRNVRTAFAHGSDELAREAMMLAATYAGIAFSNASVALVHGMSRPIGAHFHVPHGLSNAMLLPAITAWSARAAVPRYAAAARAMGAAQEEDGDETAVGKLVEALRALNLALEVPSPKAYGIAPSRWEALLPTMAAQALASGSPSNNPRVPSEAEIIALYREVYPG